MMGLMLFLGGAVLLFLLGQIAGMRKWNRQLSLKMGPGGKLEVLDLKYGVTYEFELRLRPEDDRRRRPIKREFIGIEIFEDRNAAELLLQKMMRSIARDPRTLDKQWTIGFYVRPHLELFVPNLSSIPVERRNRLIDVVSSIGFSDSKVFDGQFQHDMLDRSSDRPV